MSNVRVNSNCMMCGGCLSLGYDFLEEQSDGHVKVKDNTYLKPDSAELKALMEVCPAQAFEYDKDAVIVSKEEQLMKIKQQLKMWKGIPEPTTKDIAFDERKYSMNMPYIRGSDYSYSSDRAAENAAERAFNNGAYSKMDVFILQVISQYRADKIGPYYTYGSDTNSIYYKENQKIIQLLKEAEKLSDKNLGSDFSNFEICPSSDLAYKMLAKGELVGDELVGSVHREFDSGSYSSLSSYSMYYDTDDMEVYEIVAAIHDMTTYKMDIRDLIDLMMVWYRDVLILKATEDINQLVYQDEHKYLQKKATTSSYEGLNNIMEALEKAKVRLNANVNFDITMEMLLLTIKEN